ncbi:hypothetical protein BC827DRAFT_1158550 [Russula dissimulans]|nr:hypothetical protein BC827DRAFT_1158550 [Russula dissimulans]
MAGLVQPSERHSKGAMNILAFCLAQAIVGEDGFFGGGESVVAGEQGSCLHSNKSIPHAAPRGSLQLIDMNVYSGPSMSYFKTKKMNLSSMKRWPHTAFRFALSPVMSMAECA